MEFYGPVREVSAHQTQGRRQRTREKRALEKEFSFKIPAAEQKALGDILGPLQGDNQFDIIMRFMSGRTPAECTSEEDRQKPGTQKCIALVYEGVAPSAKSATCSARPIRPRRRPARIRREFGSNIMVNAAHASDSRGKCASANSPSSSPAKIISKQVDRKRAYGKLISAQFLQQSRVGGGKFKIAQFVFVNPLERRATERFAVRRESAGR